MNCFGRFKMRSLVFLSLVALVVSNPLVEPEGLRGYHEKVGIPLAASIKEAEDKIFAGRTAQEVHSGRIVGGVVAPENSHPYLAGLIISFVNIAGQSACGSSLLSASRLVTAAHCWFDGFNQGSSLTVVLGSQFLFYGGTRVITSTVFIHPQWTPAWLLNDVAVIYLPYNLALSSITPKGTILILKRDQNSHGLLTVPPIAINPSGNLYEVCVGGAAAASIQPIALPPANLLFDQFVGDWATAAGYGLTSDMQSGVSLNTVVSQVNIQVISVAQCQAVFGIYAQPSTICTNGAGGVGICSGDSGGPLYVIRNGQKILVGVSSFVAANGCQLGFPSAFARVTSFQSFIQQHL